jgi:hypothetical protein
MLLCADALTEFLDDLLTRITHAAVVGYADTWGPVGFLKRNGFFRSSDRRLLLLARIVCIPSSQPSLRMEKKSSPASL